MIGELQDIINDSAWMIIVTLLLIVNSDLSLGTVFFISTSMKWWCFKGELISATSRAMMWCEHPGDPPWADPASHQDWPTQFSPQPGPCFNIGDCHSRYRGRVMKLSYLMPIMPRRHLYFEIAPWPVKGSLLAVTAAAVNCLMSVFIYRHLTN